MRTYCRNLSEVLHKTTFSITSGFSISLGGSWRLAGSPLGPPVEKKAEKPHAELSTGSSGRRLLCPPATPFTAKSICATGKSLKHCKILKGSHKSPSADFLLSEKTHCPWSKRTGIDNLVFNATF